MYYGMDLNEKFNSKVWVQILALNDSLDHGPVHGPVHGSIHGSIYSPVYGPVQGSVQRSLRLISRTGKMKKLSERQN